MKEIGEKLKEARVNMDISIEEAAQDLKMTTEQLEKIELGEKEAFKDVLYLKKYIKDYAKYLGLNADSFVEEFNEYLFDYTSRLSIDDIKKASGQTKEKKVPKVVSPYTVERKQQHSIPMFLIYILVVLVVGIIIYCVFLAFNHKDSDNNVISYQEEEFYEFA